MHMKRLLSVQFLIAVLLTAALGAQSTSPLADAAMRGDTAAVKSLIKQAEMSSGLQQIDVERLKDNPR
jgi:hypothetical protein